MADGFKFLSFTPDIAGNCTEVHKVCRKGADGVVKIQVERDISVDAGVAKLEGMLAVPEGASGVVLFAHGSGSGRFSPRNQYVARVLREHSVGTLLIDLLAEWESQDRSKVFDIDLLSERLLSATDWLEGEPDTRELGIGYFGASTGAGAALQAAAERPSEIGAVVSRGGRPDLAMEYLPKVQAPTLLIVGGDDMPVIQMNREAYNRISAPKRMVIVPGATHLFEEPGTLEEVARLAAEWFEEYLGRGE